MPPADRIAITTTTAPTKISHAIAVAGRRVMCWRAVARAAVSAPAIRPGPGGASVVVPAAVAGGLFASVDGGRRRWSGSRGARRLDVASARRRRRPAGRSAASAGSEIGSSGGQGRRGGERGTGRGPGRGGLAQRQGCSRRGEALGVRGFGGGRSSRRGAGRGRIDLDRHAAGIRLDEPGAGDDARPRRTRSRPGGATGGSPERARGSSVRRRRDGDTGSRARRGRGPGPWRRPTRWVARRRPDAVRGRRAPGRQPAPARILRAPGGGRRPGPRRESSTFRGLSPVE